MKLNLQQNKQEKHLHYWKVIYEKSAPLNWLKFSCPCWGCSVCFPPDSSPLRSIGGQHSLLYLVWKSWVVSVRCDRHLNLFIYKAPLLGSCHHIHLQCFTGAYQTRSNDLLSFALNVEDLLLISMPRLPHWYCMVNVNPWFCLFVFKWNCSCLYLCSYNHVKQFCFLFFFFFFFIFGFFVPF